MAPQFISAYASIDVLGYEDSFLISDRLVKQDVLTNDPDFRNTKPMWLKTKLGTEELHQRYSKRFWKLN